MFSMEICEDPRSGRSFFFLKKINREQYEILLKLAKGIFKVPRSQRLRVQTFASAGFNGERGNSKYMKTDCIFKTRTFLNQTAHKTHFWELSGETWAVLAGPHVSN